MKKSDGSILFTTLVIMFVFFIVLAGIFALLNARYNLVQKKCVELYENEYVYGTNVRQVNETF